MDRLRAMGALVRLAELGSLSAAARSLSTTQPTVSKLIAALEDSLEVRLIERGAARVVLTDEGQRFVEDARRLLADYEESVADLHGRMREPRGLVRIAAPVALGELKLNTLMLRSLQQYPELQIELVLEDRFVDPVEERFDLTVRIGGVLPPDLVARELATWPRYIVASPDYIALHGCPVVLEDLSHHQFLRYPNWAGEEITLSSAQGLANLSMTTRYSINHAAALLNAVREGAGIAFQPCWMVNELITRQELVRLLPEWSGPAQTVYLMYPRQRRQAMRVQVMKDMLVREIQAL